MGIAKILGCLTKQPQRVILKTDCLPGENTYKKISKAKRHINKWAKNNNIEQVTFDNFQKESNEVEYDSGSVNEFFASHLKINLKDKQGKKYEMWMKFPFENQESFITKLFSTLNNYKTDHVITRTVK